MKVLLSAYACEPGKGSEPGIGWNWAMTIAKKGHEVIVITRKNNEETINNFLNNVDNRDKLNIRFSYCSFPEWLEILKKKSKLIQIYYFFWQFKAFLLARKLHQKKRFDLVHHVTFVSIRAFSLMWLLNIPFIYGPIAGGETSPFWLRWKVSIYGGIHDTLRDILINLSVFDPFHQFSLRKAKLIIVSTKYTKNLIPKKFLFKTKILCQSGIEYHQPYKLFKKDRNQNILYVGNFLYLKGMSIGLKAFAEAVKKNNRLKLTLVGKGKELNKWKNLSHKLKISQYVNWYDWVSQEQLKNFYRTHGIFLFPSLHDSAGQVLLEAMSFGMPVICLDLGGPGEMISKEIGISIKTFGSDYKTIIDKMSKSLVDLSLNEKKWEAYSLAAHEFAKSSTWEKRINQLNIY